MTDITIHRVVVNPASGGGGGANLAKRLPELFSEFGLTAELFLSKTEAHFRELVKEHSTSENHRLVICGGDGSLNIALDTILPSPGPVLGLLPCGRGNDLARSLGIPNDVKDATALLASGETRAIDIGYVGNRPFASIAGAGFDALVALAAAKTKIIKGKLVYTVAALKELVKYSPAEFEISGENFSFIGRAMMVSFANAPYYGGGMKLSPGSKLDDSLLDVCIVLPMSKLKFLRSLQSVFKGRHVDSPSFITAPVRRAHIRSSNSGPICADGELLGSLPAEIRVEAKAINIVCGKE